MEIEINNKDVYDLNKELGIYKDLKESLLKKISTLKKSNDVGGLRKTLGDKTEEEWVKYYDDYISKIQEKLEAVKKESLKTVVTTNFLTIDKKTKLKFLEETHNDLFTLKKIIKKKEISKEEIIYTVYKPSSYGSLANSFVENMTFYLIKKYPKFFNDLTHLLILSDIKILSRTYVSMMIFSTFLACIGSYVLFNLFTIISNGSVILGLIKGIPISFLAILTTPVLFYFYPYTLIGNRKKAIKNDLPFVIIHMAAIAGSGANPVSIFNLILNSGEYKGLDGEIKKIVNYVNLFGYDLGTALKAVSQTTPSNDFKDLLTGIIAATESGGDLKSYLSGKASDALSTYRLERKKYVESLATYSDIYTGVMIASPLLFMTTLAIINVIGGAIGGVSVKTISIIGTYFVIPILNIAFLVFLTLTQPE